MSINKTIIAALLVLAACSRSAPPLPDANMASTNPYKALSCLQMQVEQTKLVAKRDELEAKITGDRGYNQRVGYFGAFIPPLLLAQEGHGEEKNQLDGLQQKWDELMQAKNARPCDFK